MKKIIAMAIAITSILFCFAGCNKTNEENPNTDTSIKDVALNANNEIVVYYNDGTEKSLGKSDQKSVAGAYITDKGELILKYTNNTQENLGQIICESIWRDRNDTVYATFNVPLYDSVETQEENTFVDFKTSLKRIATNGVYDKVQYADKIMYIKSNHVTTNVNDVTFSEEDKIVYANRETLLYSYPNDTYKDMTKIPLEKNEKLICTGMNQSQTWAKIEYQGLDYYCKLSDISASET